MWTVLAGIGIVKQTHIAYISSFEYISLEHETSQLPVSDDDPR